MGFLILPLTMCLKCLLLIILCTSSLKGQESTTTVINNSENSTEDIDEKDNTVVVESTTPSVILENASATALNVTATTHEVDNKTGNTSTGSVTSGGPLDMESEDELARTLCFCNLTNHCDVNCCCDFDCTPLDQTVFSHCLPGSLVPDSRYCIKEHLLYKENTPFKADDYSSSLFCIFTDNYRGRHTYPTIPGSKSTKEYNALLKTSVFGLPDWLPTEQMSLPTESYKEGSTIWYTADGLTWLPFKIPSFLLTSECDSEEEVTFLNDMDISCMRTVISLAKQCWQYEQWLLTLRSAVFLKNPVDLHQGTESTTEVPREGTVPTSNGSSTLVSVADVNDTVTSSTVAATAQETEVPRSPGAVFHNTYTDVLLTLQSQFFATNFTDEQLVFFVKPKGFVCHGSSNCSESPLPVTVLSNGLCTNVIERMNMTFFHNYSKGLVDVHFNISLVDISNNNRSFDQHFHIEFKQMKHMNVTDVSEAGNPGYLLGQPIQFGRSAVSADNGSGDTAERIQKTEPLSVLYSGRQGSCHGQEVIRFLHDARSGCLLQVPVGHVSRNCSELKKHIVTLLMGPSLVNVNSLRIGMFRNARPDHMEDWIPILFQDDLEEIISRGRSSEPEVESCYEVPLGLHIEFVYVLQGPVSDPQLKIVGAQVYLVHKRNVFASCAKETCLEGGSVMADFFGNESPEPSVLLELTSAVSFVKAVKEYETIYPEIPSLDLKLPHDFFYPFLPSAEMSLCANAVHCTFCTFLSLLQLYRTV